MRVRYDHTKELVSQARKQAPELVPLIPAIVRWGETKARFGTAALAYVSWLVGWLIGNTGNETLTIIVACGLFGMVAAFAAMAVSATVRANRAFERAKNEHLARKRQQGTPPSNPGNN